MNIMLDRIKPTPTAIRVKPISSAGMGILLIKKPKKDIKIIRIIEMEIVFFIFFPAMS